MHFPSPDVFAGQMEKAGLKNVQKYPLDFGIVYLFVGLK
jgi:hypothetical protein